MTANSIFETRYKKYDSPSHIDNLCRYIITQQLEKIEHGRLIIEEDGRTRIFGKNHSEGNLVARITIHSASAWRIVLKNGSIGSGEAFMAGAWSSTELTKVIQIFCRNKHVLFKMDSQVSLIKRCILSFSKRFSKNTLDGSRKNIAAHYDLGNDFFSLFLDSSLMYSAAIYSHESQSLERASINKLRLTCERLNLRYSDHLLEVGTGWGGLAIYAAEKYGCSVTTTTISKEQYLYACQRVAEKGLQSKVKVLLCDYRKLEGRFDKIVSIEMIEAVGAEYYPVFFEKMDSLLRPRGKMLLQAITMPNADFKRYSNSIDFIRKYIFPGGCLPSVEVLSENAHMHSNIILDEYFDITKDYAKTLNAWRERFLAKRQEIKREGFDDTFIRMWDFYLCYCEGGFLEKHSTTHQLTFSKQATRART